MILYFTGTGNSNHVAIKLSELLNDKVISLNERIKSGDYSDLDINDNNLIIVTPTYAWRIPKIVTEYINKVKLNKVRGVYFVMTCGGEIGNANKYNKLLIESKGLTYKGSIGILMPDNYIIMFKSPSKEECDDLLNKVDDKLKDIVSYINKGETLPKNRNNLYDRLMSSFVNRQFYKYQITTKGFNVSDKCIKCLTCVNKCPLNNIKLVDDKITFLNNCTHCMGCISYCPVNAINYKKKTINKKPYKIEDYIK